MADIGHLVEQFLDTKRVSKRWNFYTVLGIEELLDDRTMIAVALEDAITSLKAADRTSDPEGFEQIVKIVRQARATLLDEEKKSAYDKQLAAVLKKANEKSPQANVSSQPSAEMVKLQTLLPPGDPTSPFSMSDFLRQPNAELPQESPAERKFALLELARQSTTPDATPGLTKPVAATAPPTNQVPAPNRSGSSSAKQLQAQIRRNRQRKNMIASASVLGVATIVIGFAVGMYLKNEKAQREKMAMDAEQAGFIDGGRREMNDATSVATDSNKNASSKATGKKRMNVGVGDSNDSTVVSNLPKMNFPLESQEANSTSDAKMMDQPDVKSIPEGANPAMAAESPKPAPPNEPPPSSEPAPPNPDAMKKWTEAMTAARSAMVSRDFDKFHSNMEKATSLPHTDKQEEQLKRLDNLGQMLEKGMAILQSELAKRKGSEVLNFGSTLSISIVESKENELILREAGVNKTYKHDELPMGIVMGLVNLDLTDAPIDEGIRGAMNLLAPQSKAVNKTQSQKFFDKAAEGDPNFAGLGEVLKDTY